MPGPRDYGRYTVPGPTRVHLKFFAAHIANAPTIHRILAQSFHSMVPAFYRARVEEARGRNIPLFGVPYDVEHSAVYSSNSLYTPNIAYTFGGFENLGHKDNDINKRVNGMWGPTDKSGALTPQAEGISSVGGFFLLRTLPSICRIRTD